MLAALFCLSCFHWMVSYRHASEDKLNKTKEFYCDECKLDRLIIYRGLVEPQPSFVKRKVGVATA